MSYKDTVFLPKTDFSMRGNLTKKEPEILKDWDKLYQTLRKQSDGQKKFILNFGPPYANGHIHIGHALSEVLKDIVNKTFQMKGFDAPMIPGWDCHGLPIEWKVEEEYRKKGKKKEEINTLEFRQSCREFAEKWMNVQKEELKRLGIIADFDESYSTMNFYTEGLIVEQLSHFLLKGMIYRGHKPVMWSVVEQTALADNEVEYKTITSPSIYVSFPVENMNNTYAVIWTTTPWTIPANRAIAYNPKLKYVFLETEGKKYIIAEGCVDRFIQEAEVTNYKIGRAISSEELVELTCKHPLYSGGYNFTVPMLPGDHVTTEAGTGLVHTAPTHGEEDFALGQKFDLEIPELIGDSGVYHEHVPLFAGHHIFKVNDKVIEELEKQKNLVVQKSIEHSYPHSWRSKKPLIYRTTHQWFIDIDDTGIRKRSLDAIKNVDWVPKEGYNRIKSMLEKRPDWCISRQRVWGTPLAIFINKKTKEVLQDTKVQENIVSLIKEHGGDIWFTEPNETFLQGRYEPTEYEKVMDILDVWFDSGCVHEIVLNNRKGQKWPADLYLEGSDQHRGWFQTSLLEAMGVYGRAPYKAVLTHGFVLDEKGYKMSKSVGNTVSPQDVMNEYGADVLRQWIVLSDYTEDLRIGKDILKYHQELYRRFRNTVRYLLGALCEFSNDEIVDTKEMPELEQYILHKLYDLCMLHIQCVEKYDFQRFYTELHNFCATDLSSFYFDIRKDCLYCDSKDSIKRRSTRTVMYHLFQYLVRWMAPVHSFTAEEAWRSFTGDDDQSIHGEQFLMPSQHWFHHILGERWEKIKNIRAAINSSLEEARAEKKIGSSLEAKVKIYTPTLPCTPALLNELCITSVLEHHMVRPPNYVKEENGYGILIEKAPGQKCERCWKVLEEVGKTDSICGRCKRACAIL